MAQQIACIAVIGPDNNPLIIQKYCEETQELEIDTCLFCSLDYFDGQPMRKTSSKLDRFLGSIQTSDRFQIWGYRAALGYKIIILTFHTTSLQDTTIRTLCEKTKDVLFDALMDPFYAPFSIIESPAVIAKIDDLSRIQPAP
jgi:hypothetical protein